MKFVRWLGAFGRGNSLLEAGNWEVAQIDRQVAAEPLWRGKSLIGHATIGLEIDHDASIFRSGWLSDAWTVINEDGVLVSNPPNGWAKDSRKDLRRFKDMDRFLATWSRIRSPTHHAEAAFASPVYVAVVVKSRASDRGKQRAATLAAALNLPIKVIR